MRAKRTMRIIWRINGHIPKGKRGYRYAVAAFAIFSVDNMPEIQYNGNVSVDTDIGIE